MPAIEQHIVVPYRRTKGQMVPGEARQSRNVEHARRLAASMATRFDAVAAYSIQVDRETGDMASPALIVGHGPFPAMNVD
jgi:hypothetical protein